MNQLVRHGDDLLDYSKRDDVYTVMMDITTIYIHYNHEHICMYLVALSLNNVAGSKNQY